MSTFTLAISCLTPFNLPWFMDLTFQVPMNSGRWWRTGRPGVLQFMGSQRVGLDWVTELNWRFEPLHVIQEDWNQLRPIPVNVDILASYHESLVFLMASRMLNLFQKAFNLLCLDPAEESLSMTAIALQIVSLKNKRLESWNDSLISGLKNWCFVSSHENNVNLMYLH